MTKNEKDLKDFIKEILSEATHDGPEIENGIRHGLYYCHTCVLISKAVSEYDIPIDLPYLKITEGHEDLENIHI